MPNGKRANGLMMLGLAALGIALFTSPEWALYAPTRCNALSASFITIYGLTGAVVCFYKASAIYKVTSRDTMLATWTVEGPLWREFLRHSLKAKYRASFKNLLLFLAAFLLFSSAFPLSNTGYNSCIPLLLIIPALSLLAAILYTPAWFIRMRLAKGRMVLSYNGVYCHGSFHTWEDRRASCKSLFLRKSPFHHLELTVYKTSFGRKKEKVYLLPVPQGRTKMAEEAVEIFRMGMKN